MRPCPAVPRIEPVVMPHMHYTGTPVVINVNVIQADMIVVIVVVPPTPAMRAPPRMAPGPQPFTGSKAKAKTNSPVIRKSGAKSISAWLAHPVVSDIRRIVPTRAIDHDVVRAHFRAQITWSIAHINLIRRRAVNLRVGDIMEW